MSDVVNC